MLIWERNYSFIRLTFIQSTPSEQFLLTNNFYRMHWKLKIMSSISKALEGVIEVGGSLGNKKIWLQAIYLGSAQMTIWSHVIVSCLNDRIVPSFNPKHSCSKHLHSFKVSQFYIPKPNSQQIAYVKHDNIEDC
jgi:hypothetical protein